MMPREDAAPGETENAEDVFHAMVVLDVITPDEFDVPTLDVKVAGVEVEAEDAAPPIQTIHGSPTMF